MLNIFLKKLNVYRYKTFYLISLPLLAYYYLGIFRVGVFLVYFLSIFHFFNILGNKGKINFKTFVSISFFVFVLSYSLFTFSSLTSYLLSLRLNFGIFPFLLVLPLFKLPRVESMAYYLSLITIFEKILILFFPFLINYLSNYDGTFTYSEATSIFGGVHSFGGSRTVSAVLLFSFFVYLDVTSSTAKKIKLFTLITSFICMSGTQFLFGLVYFFFRFVSKIKFKFKNIFILIISLPFFYFLIANFFNTSFEELFSHRFSFMYYDFLYNYKYDQIIDLKKDLNLSSFLFGLGSDSMTNDSTELSGGYGSRFGDFQILDFLSRYGLIGVVSFVIIVLLNIKSLQGKIFFLILFIMTFHYHILFAGPSQIIIPFLIVNFDHYFIKTKTKL